MTLLQPGPQHVRHEHQLGTFIFSSSKSLRRDSLLPGSRSVQCFNRGFSDYPIT